jgi:hypothetical protein
LIGNASAHGFTAKQNLLERYGRPKLRASAGDDASHANLMTEDVQAVHQRVSMLAA